MSQDTRGVATLLLLQEVVIRQLAHQKGLTREAALDAFDVVGVRDIGVVGDEQIGSVQLTKGATRASVFDEEALIGWLLDQDSENVLTVTSYQIRPAYLTALLNECKAQGAPVTKDGEVIPGIQVTQADPSLMVKPSEDATDVLARAFAEGRLTLADLTAPVAIEAGP